MPAVTLQNSTIHTSQNCRVRMALRAETWFFVTRAFDSTYEGSNPSGFQSSAGTLIVNAPKSM